MTEVQGRGTWALNVEIRDRVRHLEGEQARPGVWQVIDKAVGVTEL